MKKRLKIAKQSAKKSRRFLAITIFVVATAILATGAVTVVSRQNMKKETSIQQSKAPAANVADGKYVTVKVAGREVQVDAQTGRLKELTPEEAQKLAAELKQMVNRSSEGLVPEQRADGSVTVDLQDHFQSVQVARIDDNGALVTSCVDNAEAAGAFFGIDPRMIDPNADGNKSAKPQLVAPAKTEAK